jgi:hypothetical protein
MQQIPISVAHLSIQKFSDVIQTHKPYQGRCFCNPVEKQQKKNFRFRNKDLTT